MKGVVEKRKKEKEKVGGGVSRREDGTRHGEKGMRR